MISYQIKLKFTTEVPTLQEILHTKYKENYVSCIYDTSDQSFFLQFAHFAKLAINAIPYPVQAATWHTKRLSTTGICRETWCVDGVTIIRVFFFKGLRYVKIMLLSRTKIYLLSFLPDKLLRGVNWKSFCSWNNQLLKNLSKKPVSYGINRIQ